MKRTASRNGEHLITLSDPSGEVYRRNVQAGDFSIEERVKIFLEEAARSSEEMYQSAMQRAKKRMVNSAETIETIR